MTCILVALYATALTTSVVLIARTEPYRWLEDDRG